MNLNFEKVSDKRFDEFREHIWPCIINFCNFEDIRNCQCLAKFITAACKLSYPVLTEKVYGANLKWIETKIPKFQGLSLSSSNDADYTTILENLIEDKKSFILSLTKCFRLKNTIANCISSCKSVALCDISFDNSVIYSHHDLNALILSNSTFGINSKINLENSNKLKWISFGGCKNLTIDHLDKSNIHSESIYVETTFLTNNDLIFSNLLHSFPNAIFINLENDPIDVIEQAINHSNFHSSMRFGISSCADGRNRTILHISCLNYDIERVKWLLYKMNSKLELKDNRGSTPLHRAVQIVPILKNNINSSNILHKDEIIQLLMNYIDGSNDSSLIELLFDRNHNHQTPIYFAALQGNFNALAIIFRSISMPKNDEEMSLLLFHNSGRWGERKWCELQALQREGFQCGLRDCYSVDEKNFSPLHAAVISKSLQSVQILLSAGFSSNFPNIYKETPLHLAYRSLSNSPCPNDVCAAIVQELLRAGARSDLAEDRGLLPPQYGQTAQRTASGRNDRRRKKQTDRKTPTPNQQQDQGL